MDRERLAARLTATFDVGSDELRVVVRQAVDLRDAGRYEATHDRALTATAIVDGLIDAPSGGLVDRWNWWIGALELAHGGFERFLVRSWVADDKS